MSEMRRSMMAGFVVASLQLAVLVDGTQADSTLAPGVTAVSPEAGKSITDPEQLDQRTPAHLVQDLHAAFGAHKARAVHSKGFILQGSFAPSPEAHTLSQAKFFTITVPVIVRFSDFTGLPAIPDTNPNGQPRGLALKFLLPDGSNYDTVNHSYNGFPSPTAADFGDLLQAIGQSGEKAAKPTPLDRYLETHPTAKHFLTTQTAPPESWAATAYFGVNAYQFTNDRGTSTYVRYRFVPNAGEHYLDAKALAGKSNDYLSEASPTPCSRFAMPLILSRLPNDAKHELLTGLLRNVRRDDLSQPRLWHLA